MRNRTAPVGVERGNGVSDVPDKVGIIAEAWGTLKLWGGLFLTWAAGSTGQAMIAGSAGGFVRWVFEKKAGEQKTGARLLLDGLVAVIMGAIFARYFGPVAEAVIANFIGELGEGAAGTAAFAAGLSGMSITKIVIAAVDAQHRRVTEDKK